jgi:hypothetical protein
MHMTSYLSLLLQRRLAEALKAAEAVAPAGKTREFVASQASERAYTSFRFSVEERMEALRQTSVRMQSVTANRHDEDADLIEEQRKKMVDVVALLRGLAELDNQMMSARDWQILGRASGYCGLLSRCSTEIYPQLTRFPALVLQIPKLSLVIHRDLTPIGPSGPLENDGLYDAGVFREFAMKKIRGVDDWFTGIVRLVSDTKDKKLMTECIEALNTDEIDRIFSARKKSELISILNRVLNRLP